MPLTDSSKLQVFKQAMKLMGNQFEISVVAEDEAFADEKINDAVAEIKRIEQLLTTFRHDSQTNQINENAGIKPVKIDSEVFHLIQRSLRISEISQGAFDITYGSLDKRFWNFDKDMDSLPDKELAKQSVALINYKNVILDAEGQTVFLKEKGMRIGFGGIGKGYAADRAKRLLQEAGVANGIVNASGDLVTWGLQPNGQPWTVGIADPEHKLKSFSYMNISNMAIATSGNYEKFAVINGKKYSHTIDPHTGFPVAGIKSVSIICPQAELADALATPVTVMGVEVGLNLINQLNNVACIIIDDDNKLYTSKNININ
ncbi:MAG: FAD:protein FMN transferase [Bacteroidetes bacterium]|nr:FAD:protein FMN transferase [Bacteroidota bacterium]MBU1484293.1 FAD:protein FMN transferase [Bacteroidota bacterium]MBU2045790.1 FAD:protein FMN transferase [Bacteroidota bacterium]MBU2267554.1 FAD:protein FMN transferase [Bacteroidota bacterium]MBU2377043.1 FAD:protein FMN transferase [Bacteroidota bacterium]